MDYQGSVYYYYGYSSFMKGKGQFEGERLQANSESRLEWFRGYREAMADHQARNKREMENAEHQFDNSSQQLESLAAKPVVTWNGEGLPPCGCQCEVAQPGQINWSGFRVVTVNGAAVFGFWDNGVPSALDSDNWLFRPAGFEQKRKSEEVANALSIELGDIEKYATWTGALNGVYALVAAGKIPHLKLESDDE